MVFVDFVFFFAFCFIHEIDFILRAALFMKLISFSAVVLIVISGFSDFWNRFY